MKSALSVLFCVLLALALRGHDLRQVFVENGIYFVDADCYSRMQRAEAVAKGERVFIRHHDFENFPAGTVPHTTAPMDWLIVSLKLVLDLAFRLSGTASVLRPQALDLAGALISPLLGGATCLWLGIWAQKATHAFGRPMGTARLAVPCFFAISPVLVHGTLLGRPDHQSLLLLFVAVALGAEVLIANDRGKPWPLVSGVAWALSFWVSLYEPLILFTLAACLWLLFKPRDLWSRGRLTGWLAMAAIVGAALLLEGWRLPWPDPALRAAFANWKQTIGELAHLDPRTPLLYRWLGGMVLLTPVLLALERKRQRLAAPILLLLTVVFALTVWQLRWGYFLGSSFA